MALGETLRRARETRRISLNQAALETRIRQAVLEALEDGDYTGVPPRPFLRGLLRNYALYLHLDADSVLDEYDYETGHKPAIPRTPPPEPEPRAPIPPAIIAIAQGTQPSAPPAGSPEDAFAFPPFQIPTAPKMTGDADVGGPTALPPAPETVYQVAPGLGVQEPEPTAPLNLSQEPPSLARRIGGTRIPEAVAILSMAVALFILVSVGFTAFQNFTLPFATAPTEQPTRIPSATVPRGSTPTGIPTLPQTAAPLTSVSSVLTTTAQAGTVTAAATGSVTQAAPTGTPTFDVPEDTQIALEVQANDEMGVWGVVDGDTVFNGTLTGESRTFIPRAQMFMQIKNIESGRVFFQGTRILPRNQQERFDLARAWFMNPLGTPVIVPPTPFPIPVEPTSPPTFTPVPTETPTRTVTPTTTNTRTATATRTDTPTVTPSRTPTLSRTPLPTRTMTASPTASSTRTVTLTPTETAMPTETLTPENTETQTETATPENTETPTETATPENTETPTEMATPENTETPTETATPENTTTATATRTVIASRTRTPTAAVTRTATQAPTTEATITQAAPPSPSQSRTATATRTRTRTRTATPFRTATRTPTRTRTPTP